MRKSRSPTGGASIPWRPPARNRMSDVKQGVRAGETRRQVMERRKQIIIAEYRGARRSVKDVGT